MVFNDIKTLTAIALRGEGLQAALRVAQYNASARQLTRRYGRKKPQGRFQTLGESKTIVKRPQGMLIHTERGFVEAQFVTPAIARIRMRADANFDAPFSYAVERIDWPPPMINTRDEPDAFIAQSEQFAIRIEKADSRLVFQTADGHVISEDAEGIAWREHEVRWTRQLSADERCYGLGQRASALNLRGQRVALWNSDPLPGYARNLDPMYYSVPFYLGTQPDCAFGVLWDNPARGYVDLGQSNARKMTFFAEDNELRFYLFVGENVEAVLGLYADLTGKMALPPLWALGYHQSRWGYETETDFRALAREFRQRQLPCDTLYFDIDYMDDYRVFTWNRQRFPDLPNLLADLSGQGFKAVAIVDPGIKIDPGYEAYDSGLREDVFLKYPDGTPVTAPVWPGNCHFPDFTSPEARAWWAARIATLLDTGFAGIWNDMNEPAVINYQRGATLPDYIRHAWDTSAGEGKSHVAGGHNVYGMLMARATREGIQKQRPKQRPFVMTRAGYAGAQRYAATWTGDNAATWDHLRLSVSMTLNAGLSGIPFTGPDVGGFAGDPDGELFARWMQLGSLLPYFRNHTMKGTAPQEPWAYGEKYEKIARHYLELRYQLLPYIYSAFAQAAQDGLPVARPLFMADPGDENLRACDDAFMVGSSILVAPVLEPGATQREIYLPRGVWYEYHTGKLIDGARALTVDAPLDRMPIYARAGHVIPMWPVMQYVGEKSLDEARLRIYAGVGETTFYEDAGEGLRYREGDYRWSYFTCKFLASGQFSVEWRRAGQYHPPYTQIRVEIVGISGEPASVMIDGQAAPIWYYEDGIVEFIVGSFGEARIVGRKPGSQSSADRTLVRPPRRLR